MEIENRALIVLSMIICLFSVARAAEGTATFYTAPYTPSACYGYQNNGVKIAAASDVLWNNGAVCGRNYRITCIGAAYPGMQPCKSGTSIVVKIVDYCPKGCHGTIDLSKEAFSAIANPDAGVIRIRYTQ